MPERASANTSAGIRIVKGLGDTEGERGAGVLLVVVCVSFGQSV